MTVARWIDLGDLPPMALHTHYTAVGLAARVGDVPVVLWGRSREPHVAIGATQSAPAELDLGACRRAGVPWLRRPLGGGTVWVDDGQWAYFVVFPPEWRQEGRPMTAAAAFRAIAPAFVALHGRFGLAVDTKGGQDFWCGGRKIGGTGAATLGNALVLGGSLLLHFDPRPFAALVAAPSEGFRGWLAAGLADSMTSWMAQGVIPPNGRTLGAAFRETLGEALGWGVQESGLTTEERRFLPEAASMLREETAEAEEGGRRRVPHGIKIKAGTFLAERHWTDGWLRVQSEGGRIARAAGSRLGLVEERALRGVGPDAGDIAGRLQVSMGEGPAALWAERIVQTTVWREFGMERES